MMIRSRVALVEEVELPLTQEQEEEITIKRLTEEEFDEDEYRASIYNIKEKDIWTPCIFDPMNNTLYYDSISKPGEIKVETPTRNFTIKGDIETLFGMVSVDIEELKQKLDEAQEDDSDGRPISDNKKHEPKSRRDPS